MMPITIEGPNVSAPVPTPTVTAFSTVDICAGGDATTPIWTVPDFCDACPTMPPTTPTATDTALTPIAAGR
jgi:hypothetical protein